LSCRLIPPAHRKENLEHRLQHVKVRKADEITQQNSFTYESKLYVGRNTVGEVASNVTEKHIDIYLDGDGIESPCASLGFCDMIAGICKIVDHQHRELLQQTLSDIKHKKLQELFSKHGIYVAEIVTDGNSTTLCMHLWHR
jgi:hypothetical protein